MPPKKTQTVQYFAVGYNPDWFASASIALETGLWMFPTSLVANLKEPFLDMLHSVGVLALSVVALFWHHLWLTLCGVAGYVVVGEVEVEIDDEPAAPDDDAPPTA